MAQNEPKKIIILTSTPFPVGLAGTNRILAYCKGFLYYGYNPEVICIKPTESNNNVINSTMKGTYNGIQYSYPGGTTIRVTSFLGRRKNDIIAFFCSLKMLIYFLQKNKVAFVIFYGKDVINELSCILIARLFHTRIFKEESEHPHVLFGERNSVFIKIMEWFYTNKLYNFYSGVLVMTNPLKDFFLTKGIPRKNILVVPHTIDHERFENKAFNSIFSFEYDYIAYLGPINQYKDGVLSLIESFAKVSAKYPQMHLIIAGEGSPLEKNRLTSHILKLQMNEWIHYIGRISYDEIPSFFHGAKLLASCRTKSFQNEFSFPTKVVEYLASGRPVVTTAPGELAFYLEDRVSAFIANLDDPNAFTSKIFEVLQDYDFAMKVALKGKELVKNKFNPIIQTKKIIEFCID